MNRRAFLASGTVLLAAPFTVDAEPAKRLPRTIAFFCVDSCTTLPSARFPGDLSFVRGLERAGQVLGRNVQIDASAVGIGSDRLDETARRLRHRHVSVIVVNSALTALAARRASTSIPIVLIGVGDPVEEGLVEGLARPGGYVTGLAIPSGQLVAKQIEFLQQIRPSVTRVAVLWDPRSGHAAYLTRVEGALERLGVRVHRVELSSQLDTEKALTAVAAARPDALLGHDHLPSVTVRREISLFALRARLPTVASTTAFAGSGALVTYGPNIVEVFERAAGYVARILNGAKPSELPVEEPTRFDLILNATTAKALGLAIPASLLARADQVIE